MAEGSRVSEAAQEEKQTGRVEAFSDGVFSIAITLLVLELKIPHQLPAGTTLLEALAQQWPSYVAFLNSFATIGIVWINHHRLFTHMRRVDHGLLILNMFLLLGVTIAPFPTAVLAEHKDERIAALLYCLLFAYITALFRMLWRRAYRKQLMGRQDIAAEVGRVASLQYRLAPYLYLLCAALAFVSVEISVIAAVSLVVLFAFPTPSERRKK